MNEYINWSEFTVEHVASSLPKLIANAEKGIAAIEKGKPNTYDGLVHQLGDVTRPLYACWGKMSHMLGVMNDERWRKLQEEWQPRIVEFSLRVSQSRILFELAKSLINKTDGVRKRILEKTIQGAELAGVGLEGAQKERFNEISSKLAKLASDFYNAVIDATTPEISDANFPLTMKNDPDRAKRERLYRKRVTRAPENAARIKEILILKKEIASLLGFKNYAQLSLASKCAPSVAAVDEMINRLDNATLTIAKREDSELGEGLMPWDFAFAAERLREKKYAYSEEELKHYFELEDVLKGLFKICKFLFNIEVKELVGSNKPSVWHQDVRFFEVYEKDKLISAFYFDPYVRTGLKSGGAWMNEFRSRRVGVNPLATIVTNFPLPENGKCLLPFREVETLFHEFGHALQQMLTRIEEEDAAGINLVEWDAVEVASQFMENWCLDDRTGIKVPTGLKTKVRAAKNFRAASQCRRQLSFAKTDILLHSLNTVDDANDVKCEIFRHFGMPMIEEDRFLNAFTHIFAGGYSAGYYGYKWAEVMSADCFGAFEEVGLTNDEAMRELGAKYRETILALGGSESALAVFRKFRGRDPEISALLRQQDML